MTAPAAADIPRNTGRQTAGSRSMSATANRLIERAGLQDIAQKLVGGERLHLADGRRLFATVDLAAVGALADIVRRIHHGDLATFVAPVRMQPQPDASALPLDEQLDRLRRMRRQHPKATLVGWSAPDVHAACAQHGSREHAFLKQLFDAGLDAIGGQGASILHPRMRRRVDPNALQTDQWLAIHRTAHGIGLRSSATLRFGCGESTDARLDHLLRLRHLQDETGGLDRITPLKARLQPGRQVGPREATGFDCLRTLAVCRLMLDNVSSVAGSTLMLGTALSQTSLSFGVDALDPTPQGPNVHRMGSEQAPTMQTQAELVAAIRHVGCVPVQRNLHRV